MFRAMLTHRPASTTKFVDTLARGVGFRFRRANLNSPAVKLRFAQPGAGFGVGVLRYATHYVSRGLRAYRAKVPERRLPATALPRHRTPRTDYSLSFDTLCV
jgi:hypothetical protein